MTFKLPMQTFALCVAASSAVADMVVINGRYMVHDETVRAYFYRDGNRQTVFDVRWSDWSTQYRCTDTYDEIRVKAASLNFALQLDDAAALDFAEFLEAEGFQGCAKF